MAQNSVQIKICGITNPQDALAASQAGVDAIGLNFVGGPRKIDADQAAAIVRVLPDAVGVWVLAEVGGGDLPRSVESLTAQPRVTHVQMYGPVAAPTIARVRDRNLRTVAVRHVADDHFAAEVSAWLEDCGRFAPDLLLLDAAGPSLGGTGQTLDWDMIATHRRAGHLDGWPPIVLAGGLKPGNVAQAVNTVAPAWVDVSSGVELSPARKDSSAMRVFVEAAKSAPTAP